MKPRSRFGSIMKTQITSFQILQEFFLCPRFQDAKKTKQNRFVLFYFNCPSTDPDTYLQYILLKRVPSIIFRMRRHTTFVSCSLYSLFYKNLFMAALGLHCCAQAFSSCGERGLLLVVVHRLLIAVASLVAEHGLQACGVQQLWLAGSRAQAQQLWRKGLVAPRHVGSSRPGIEPMSPALQVDS